MYAKRVEQQEYVMVAGETNSTNSIYRNSSGMGISVLLLAAHIAGCSSGRASMSAILTSEHYSCISMSSTGYESV